MATDSQEELRRLKDVILKLSAEIGGKNQKTEYIAKKLKQGSTALSEMKEETHHLDQAYKEEKRNMKITMLENQRLQREIENQRREIEQQVKEIKKRDAQLDFKNKQLLVLRMLKGAAQAPEKVNTLQGRHEGVENGSGQDKVQLQIDTNGLHQAPQKVNTVQGRHEGVQNMSSLDKVQVHVDTIGLHNELEEKDYELNRQKQTLGVKEHRSNHDLQEARKVSIVEIGEEDDEKSVEILDDWRMEDCEFSEEEECNSFEDTFPPIPPPESSVDLCNDMQNSSSHLSVIIPDSEVKKGDECGKGDIEGGGGVETVECNAFQDMFPPIAPPESSVDPCNDMQTNSSDLSSVLPVPEVKKRDECVKGDIEGGGVETVECNAFQDMFPPIAPPESFVDPCSGMPNNCSDFSFVLPDPDCEMTDMEWLSTFVDDSMSAGDITVGIDFSDNNKNDDSATVLMNSSSSCSGGKTMALSPDTAVLDLYGASAHDQQFSVSDPLQI